MTTRRNFLSAALGSTAVLSCGRAAPAIWWDAAAEPAQYRDRALVVVQLSGGNDGLNTVVPYRDGKYRSARPKLAIPTDDLLKIDSDHGLHPSLRGLETLLQDNQLCIAQGVGYPQPNRSHFESMDIWHSCRRKSASTPRDVGWLGRLLDGEAARASEGKVSDVPALHLGREEQPLALAAQRVRCPSVRNLDEFRLQAGDDTVAEAVRQLVGAKRPADDPLLSFVQESATAALNASRRVEQAKRSYKPTSEYPQSALAEKLQLVAQLIDAELPTRIYYVTLDGFDTHSQQPNAHAALLRQFGDAVQSFVGDIDGHGHGSRVLVMAFSEFGRRVEENASDGTDHGAAGPMFLAGKSVQSGLLGKHPSLDDLINGDLKFHTDFRQIYATVLERWFGQPSKEILGGAFAPVDALTA